MVMVFEDLGIAVNRAYDSMKKNISEAFFREQVAAKMGLSASSLWEYIRNYKELGNIYGSASPNPQQRNTRLKKTSVFLWALGFSEEDESHAEVINGIRERAAERGDRFEYPPPEDKRISYEEIKQKYSKQNIVVEGEPANEQNGDKEESVADRVNRLLTMPISEKPDNEHPYRVMIAREVYIKSVINENTDFGVGVIIKVTPQQSATGEVLHSDTYRIYYFGYINGEGVGVRTWRALNEFLSQTEVQKTRIVYNQRLYSAQRISDIRMIAPVGSEIVYLMDNRMLKPYNLRENKFIGV